MYFRLYKIKKYLLIFLFLAYPLVSSAVSLDLLNSKKLGEQKEADNAMQATAGFAASTGSKGLPTAVALVINVFIGLLGTIFLILIVVSGWNWFTAQGDTKKIDTAKARMVNAIIGLIIVLSAYAITVFVFSTGDELQLMNNGG
jgi:hypothetical protein